MTRIKDTNTGLVHYVCPAHGGHTLCARTGGTDLLGNFVKLGEPTAERVTCPDCAKVVCAIRNEPYNTLVADIDDATLDTGIWAAVQGDGPVETTREASHE